MGLSYKKLVLIMSLLLTSSYALAATVQQQHKGLTLNANLELVNGKKLGDSVILITHGTLAHGKMEITTALQDLFTENELDSISITLGLGQNDRKGMYDCATTHTHKHTDALDEIGLWVSWLKKQGVKNITLLGHSRGGNQTAWYASERHSDVIKNVILIAPATWNRDGEIKSYKKKYGKDYSKILAKAEKLVAKGSGKTVMKNIDHIYCKDTSVTAESFVSYYRDDRRLNTVHFLDKIKAPVLVFAGSKDKVVKNLDKKVAPFVKKGKVVLNVLDGADHMFRDLHADDMVDAIVDYLSE